MILLYRISLLSRERPHRNKHKIARVIPKIYNMANEDRVYPSGKVDPNVRRKDFKEKVEKIKDYILFSLGYPVIQIELQNEHILTGIMHSLQTFMDYAAFDRGTRILDVNSEDSTVDIPEDICAEGIYDIIFEQSNFIGSSSFGDPIGAIKVGGSVFVQDLEEAGLFGGSRFELTTYMAYLQRLEDISEILGRDRHWEIINGKIKLYPTDMGDTRVGIIYTDYSPIEILDTEIWVRDYALAKIKTMWGHILRKISGFQTPSGTNNLPGNELISEGTQDMERLLQELKTERRRPMDIFQV